MNNYEGTVVEGYYLECKKLSFPVIRSGIRKRVFLVGYMSVQSSNHAFFAIFGEEIGQQLLT